MHENIGPFYSIISMSPEPTTTYRVSLSVSGSRGRSFRMALKRALDIGLGGTLLVLSLPILLSAMLAVRISGRGSALFVQRRIGENCVPFRMWKLRTMVDGAEEEEAWLGLQQPERVFFKHPDDPRITPVGRFLRRSSLDELPQLFNVLRGEMSLVGPRPLLLSDFEKFPRGEQLARFSMKPGLTGLWQVSGRSLLDDRRRIRLDLEYVENWSLALDLRILARTLPAVMTGRGAV